MNKERKRTILIVEDDENSFLYLLIALEELNYNILRAPDGLEAIRIFSESKIHIDLILMDLKLPLIDGFQCSEAIRKIKPNVPIIAQTASYLPLITQKLNDHKFNGVIIKPFTVEQLLDVLNKVINQVNNFNKAYSQTIILHCN